MPEGDALHRAARRLQVLVGEQVEVESPHPRARATGVAGRIDGRTLIGVEARGKNLMLRFDGDYVLRSHLGMSGSWSVIPRGGEPTGRPWLVLRGSRHQAVLRGGPIIELTERATRRLGPDILTEPPAFDEMLANMRRAPAERELGEALLDQRLVAGIGNMWKAEALWQAEVSPWRRLGETSDEDLRHVLREAARLMQRSLDGKRLPRAAYRRAGRPCPRCGSAITSRGQGDANRIAYWCPICQATPGRAK